MTRAVHRIVGWRQVVLVVRQECLDALRSRRALAIVLLYVLVAVLTMNGFLSMLQRLETELAAALQLPAPDGPGGLTHALWRSERFRRMMARVVGTSLAAELTGTSPIALAYAALTFGYAPLLVVLVAPARIAEEIGGGSVRLMLLRTTRLRWSIGKLAGLGVLIALALALGAASAWLLTYFRMPGADRLALLPVMLHWAGRTWIYGFAFLGLSTGVAHLARGGGRATLLALLAISAIGLLSWAATRYGGEGWRQGWEVARQLAPQAHRADLWRQSAASRLPAAVSLLVLGLVFHLCGYALWRRRDV